MAIQIIIIIIINTSDHFNCWNLKVVTYIVIIFSKAANFRAADPCCFCIGTKSLIWILDPVPSFPATLKANIKNKFQVIS